MAKGTVKVLVSVEIELPDSSAVGEKLKGAELNEWLRERATNDVQDALIEAKLNPEILRVRVAREGK